MGFDVVLRHAFAGAVPDSEVVLRVGLTPVDRGRSFGIFGAVVMLFSRSCLVTNFVR